MARTVPVTVIRRVFGGELDASYVGQSVCQVASEMAKMNGVVREGAVQ